MALNFTLEFQELTHVRNLYVKHQKRFYYPDLGSASDWSDGISALDHHFAGKLVGSVFSPECLGGPGLLPTRVGKPLLTSTTCLLFSHANLRVLCGNLKQLLYTLRFLTHQIKICF